MLKILIIAGELSGDALGANLIKEIALQHAFQNNSLMKKNVGKESDVSEELMFQGIGGPLMKKQGLVSLYNIKDLAVMGLTEVLTSLPKILAILGGISRYVKIWNPDLVITIDSPDFSIRLAKKLRKIDKFVPIIHYVAPSVWAWRPLRAKQMGQYFDHVLALFPFEAEYFEKFGLSCDFVGHPVARQRLPDKNKINFAISKMNLDTTKRTLTLLPGSRNTEIKYMLPIFISVIKRLEHTFNDLEIIIPAPLHVSKLVKEQVLKAKINVKIMAEEDFTSEGFQDCKYSLFTLSELALATSGSVSLELARAGTPMITAYRCGFLFEIVLKRFVLIKSANLINIISETKIVPEFLFEECNADNIFRSIYELLTQPKLLLEQKELHVKVLDSLVSKTGGPSHAAAKTILSYINQ